MRSIKASSRASAWSVGLRIVVPVLALSTSALPAWALRPVNTSTLVAAVPSKTAAAGTASSFADDSSSMREGVITAVNAKHDQVQVNGSWLKLPDGRAQVFRSGMKVSHDSLAAGQHVKFILGANAAGAADHATIGALYVP